MGHSSNRIRVAHVLPNLDVGGQEVLVLRLCTRLRECGVDPSVIGLTGGGPLEQEFAAAAIPVSILTGRGRLRGYPASLVRELGARPVTVLHSHSGTWFPTAVAGALRRIPVVHTEHGRYPGEPRWVRWADRVAFACTRRLVVVSAALQREMAARVGSKLPTIVANGVLTQDPLDAAARVEVRRILGAADGGPVVGTVGRLVPAKDHATLVLALAQLAPHYPSLRAAIIGDGPLRQELNALAHRLGLHDRVRFLGMRPDATRLVGGLDVYVSSSRTEGTPLAVLEAMAAGCPIVATAVGGLPHVLSGGEGEEVGVLVPVGDAEALAGAVAALLTNPVRRRQLQERARARAEVAFGLDSCARRYAEIYTEVLKH